MLCGEHPFSKSTTMETAAAILNLPVPPMTRYRQDVPEILEHIVSKMLAKEPEERYQHVHEVRTDLERVDARPRPIEEHSPALRLPALGKKQRRIGLAAFAVAALVAALAFWPDRSFGPSTEGPPSVAVLPLTNISDDPLESDYLADGISQAVATKLTQVGLRVTPWETSRRYRDSNYGADTIARELNVDAVLVGTFQIAGDEILTNLSLVDAESGFQSWADIIVEPHDDIFRMQLRIATGVAVSLKQALTGEEEEALAVPESRSVDAYDFYLQGAHVMQEGEQEATDVAFQYFRRAVELDPSLAEAHVGLGAVYASRYWFGWGGGLTNLDQAAASYEKAIQLNPASMRAQRGLIMVHFYRGGSEAALAQGQLAGRSDRPDDVETLLARAVAYHYGGLTDRALPLYRRIIEIDPLNQTAHWHLVIAAFFVGAFEELKSAVSTFVGLATMRRFTLSLLHRIILWTTLSALGSITKRRRRYRIRNSFIMPGSSSTSWESGNVRRKRGVGAWRRSSPSSKRIPTTLACARISPVFTAFLGNALPSWPRKKEPYHRMSIPSPSTSSPLYEQN